MSQEPKSFYIKTISLAPAFILGMGIGILLFISSSYLPTVLKNPLLMTILMVFICIYVPVHFFKGEIFIKIVDDVIHIAWIRKPRFIRKNDFSFKISQIQLWDYVSNSKGGPSKFVVKFKDKNKFSVFIRDLAKDNEFNAFYASFIELIKVHNEKADNGKIRNMTVRFFKGKFATVIAVMLPILFITDLILLVANPNSEIKPFLLFGLLFLGISIFIYFIQFVAYKTDKE